GQKPHSTSAFQHQLNAVRIVRPAALIEVAGLFKLGADLAKRPSLSRLGGRSPEPPGHCYRLQALRRILVRVSWPHPYLPSLPTPRAAASGSSCPLTCH